MRKGKQREAAMDDTRQTDDEQKVLWNGPAGRAWVDAQELLDQALKPMEDLLIEAALDGGAACGDRVLDVGCGTGSTTLACARRLGPRAQCVGIDISEPMIALARERAEREGAVANFIHADAQTHPFEASSFDRIISRFGVMFFNDPVRAFANLRRAARGEATLSFIAWRSPAENPFMTTAECAAAPPLPNLPASLADAPGQFAFAGQARVYTILKDSGWTGLDIWAIDVTCKFPESGLVTYLTRFGVVGRALDQADERTRVQVIRKVRAAFDPYVHGSEVRFTAACWMVSARAWWVHADSNTTVADQLECWSAGVLELEASAWSQLRAKRKSGHAE
jgi:SAM-dependent methyltransferase